MTRFEPVDPKVSFPRGRRTDPGLLEAGGHLRQEPRAARRRARVGLLRRTPDGQRPPGHPPRGGPHLQGHLPALQDDDRTPRQSEGRLGLPRSAGRARGREGDRNEVQARHRGVRHRRVQPPVPRIGLALRRRLGAAHRAHRLLDRHVRAVPNDGHPVHRERVVVAQDAARTRPALRGRQGDALLPALRDRAVGRGGLARLRDRGGPEPVREARDHRVPQRSGARRGQDRRLDDHALDTAVEPRSRRGHERHLLARGDEAANASSSRRAS